MGYKKQLLKVLLASLVGLLSWQGTDVALALAPLIVIVWNSAEDKIQAFLYILAYYLSASHGLIKGAGIFFGNPNNQEVSIFAGIAIWLIPNLLLSLPWAMLWSSSKNWWRIPLILLVISLPPLGLFGWANPITAAGILFPGLSWLGLVAIFTLIIGLCCRNSKTAIINSLLIVLSICANLIYKEPMLPAGWLGLNTNLNWINSEYDEYQHNKTLIAMVGEIISNTQETKLILLPELVVGNWTEATRYLWYNIELKARAKEITILLGGKIQLNNHEYISGLISIGKDTNKILLDRVPVPISMWRPWSTKLSARAFWFNPGIYKIQGQTVTTLICYEQLLIWPILRSMLHSPEIILAGSNVWWARDTNIPAIQRVVVSSWSRLFGIPVLFAVNR